MGVALDWDAEGAPKAKVSNLQALLGIVHQQILRLQVTVHDSMFVAVRHTLDQLVHEALQ
jgi:hypothetical protein